jgi:predicted alpha/beta-hydrolase family hydrolase
MRFLAGPSSGEVSALLTRPSDARCLVVYGHGAGADMRHLFHESVARHLARHRIGMLRYNFPYTEADRRAPDRAPVLVETVRSAVATAGDAASDLPLVAGGKSMGGRMTSTAASEGALRGVRGIVFFGFPLHRPGEKSAGRADHLKSVDVPMLFLQGTRDRLADVGLIGEVCEGLGERATLHVVDDGDHSFKVPKRAGRSYDEVIAELAVAVSAWAERLGL